MKIEEETREANNQLYWLHVPVLVSNGSVGNCPQCGITVLGYPCRLLARTIDMPQGEPIHEQWFLFDPLPRIEAEKLLELMKSKVRALSIRVGPKSGVAFRVAEGRLEVATNGHHNTMCPALIPAACQPVPLSGYGSIHAQWNANGLLRCLEDCPEIQDERLWAAFELWETASRETAARSKFLTYMTILDSLAVPSMRSRTVIDWISEKVNEAKEFADPSLKSALEGLIYQSRGAAITALIERAVAVKGGAEDEVAEKVSLSKRLYRARSALSHHGTALSVGSHEAQELAGYVMEAALVAPAIFEAAANS